MGPPDLRVASLKIYVNVETPTEVDVRVTSIGVVWRAPCGARHLISVLNY